MRSRRVIVVVVLALGQVVAGCNAPQKAPVPPVTPAPTSAAAGATTIVAIAPPAAPAAPQPSLCGFLGLDKVGGALGELFRRASSRIRTALGLEGRFPGLQPKPPLLPITDPSNLSPDAPPAVQAAAAVKNEEDQSAQKIQALRYLATIGCGGCYPTVEEAILAALDDCTEAVRYEAVLALRGDGNVCCAYCRCQGCCSPAVRKKLNSLINDRDDAGCYKEPSERVRRVARLVLAACGGYQGDVSTVPTEGPTPAPPQAPTGPDGVPVPPPPPTPAVTKSPVEPRGFSAVQLVSFEQPALSGSAHNPVLARVNGEPIVESAVVPLAEAEAVKLKLAGREIDARAFAALVAEQVERAVDAKLLLQLVHRDLAAMGRPASPLTPAELETWLQHRLVVDDYVSLAELDAYYKANVDRYRASPQVRWEQLSVAIEDAGSRDKALALVDHLKAKARGEAVDAPPVDPKIAFNRTCGPTAVERIQLKVVARAVATMPVGQTSAVLEEDGELYVVRVLERVPGRAPPFDEMLGAMKTEILAARRSAAEQALFQQLRAENQIWLAYRHGPDPGGVVVPATAIMPTIDLPPTTGSQPETPATTTDGGGDIPAPALDHFRNFPPPPVPGASAATMQP